MNRDEMLAADKRLEAYVAEKMDAALAQDAAERAEARAREQAEAEREAAAWREAMAPPIVACGVRPIFLEDTLNRAREVFELRDGKLAPKPVVVHPRDPVKDYDVIEWLSDLRAGADGDLLFGEPR